MWAQQEISCPQEMLPQLHLKLGVSSQDQVMPHFLLLEVMTKSDDGSSVKLIFFWSELSVIKG